MFSIDLKSRNEKYHKRTQSINILYYIKKKNRNLIDIFAVQLIIIC